jgi:L-2-hydroxyglutarate oxidase LhgO
LKSDSVDLIGLAKEEALKLFKKPLLRQARKLSSSLDSNYDWVKHPSGIRAQIVNSKTRSIEMDYIVKIEKNAIHILNAVSPGWTSAIPFTRWVIEQNEAMF